MHPHAREHMLDADLHAIANSRTGDCARIYPHTYIYIYIYMSVSRIYPYIYIYIYMSMSVCV
jgi:hypothetical protein